MNEAICHSFVCSLCSKSRGTKHFRMLNDILSSICDSCYGINSDISRDPDIRIRKEFIRWLASHPGCTRITEDEAIILVVMRD